MTQAVMEDEWVRRVFPDEWHIWPSTGENGHTATADCVCGPHIRLSADAFTRYVTHQPAGGESVG